MSRLFIELYLDEDVDVLLADLVRAHGFEALTPAQTGRLGLTDEKQLEYSSRQEKTFLTHNRRHFESLAEEYFLAGRDHSGIIMAVRRSPYEIARRLLVILNQVTADEMRNQLRYI